MILESLGVQMTPRLDTTMQVILAPQAQMVKVTKQEVSAGSHSAGD